MHCLNERAFQWEWTGDLTVSLHSTCASWRVNKTWNPVSWTLIATFQVELNVDGLSPGYGKFAFPTQTALFNGFLKAAGETQSQYASFKFAELDSACAGARAEEVNDLAAIKQVWWVHVRCHVEAGVATHASV